MRVIRNTTILILLLLSPDLGAIGDPQAGRVKAALCIGCHAADGNNPDPKVPKLVGQFPEYLLKQMLDYRSGRRLDPIMSNIVKTVNSVEDLTDIAAFYSSLPQMSGSGRRTELSKKGEELFVYERCIFCHNDSGRPNSTFVGGAPVIGGQNKEYLVKVLKDIRSGSHKADIYDLMQKTLSRMSHEDLEAISEYLSTIVNPDQQ